MGSFFSIQSRDKRRRSNRLSKPPANSKPASLSANSPRQPLSPSSPITSSWQNPWTGASIPIASSDSEPKGRRSHSSASASLQSDPPWMSTNKTKRSNSGAKEPNDCRVQSSPTASLSTSGTLSRRASFQPPRQPAFQPALVLNEPHSRGPSSSIQPRRSYSVQSPPRRAKSTVNASSIEEATSSNTHFLVDSQGFSLIRRRSLLTRPGIATRRSTKDAARRCPSPIKQEPATTSTTVNETSRPLQRPSSRLQDTDWRRQLSLSQLRPPTPNDFEYTHLGALKLGSLRVVNASTSPCPSDRTRLNGPRSRTPEARSDETHHTRPSDTLGERQNSKGAAPVPDNTNTPGDGHPGMIWGVNNAGFVNHHDDGAGRTDHRSSLGRQCLTTRRNNAPPSYALHTQPFSPNRSCDEPPASPLSYEMSPTTTLSPFGEKEPEDKGAPASDHQSPLPSRFGKAIHGSLLETRQSVSHKKVDSGYSSTASVRSLRASRAGSSFDSQSFTQRQALRYRRFTFGGNAGDASGQDIGELFGFGNTCPAYLLPRLRDSKMDCKFEPGVWSTSMCHEPPLKPSNRRVRSLSYTGPPPSTRMESLPRYCAHLRSQESAFAEMTASLKCQSTARLDALVAMPGQQSLGDKVESDLDHGWERNSQTRPQASNESGYVDPTMTGTPRAESENRSGQESGLEHPRFYSRTSKIRCPDAAAEKHPAMATLSTSQSVKSERYVDTPRGRPRCRSVEYQRRRLSKQQKRPNIYAAASPSVFH
ncbi:uncharacterized protein KD926_009941 [Aspergillus affinis]|uniref:uncharacterized protein n=1 Tax=Aspergillus affinis TaxID=1070780 RepID=UPI0022FEE073|nr:uncharacterized protein KD926_009941 [Aspergillus affinis]KAI9039073.1 hypothetical protein KD926_009941 [Aspergillus affinis]